jgi:DNA polymerase III alpha subunit
MDCDHRDHREAGRSEKGEKQMRIRTGYSFKHAYGKLPDVVSRLVECGYTVAPISDRMSTYGFARFEKESAKHNLRPIFGVEIPVAHELGAKRFAGDYWTFFAKEDVRDLNALVTQATKNLGHEPALTYEQAIAAKGVVKIAGSSFNHPRFIHDDDFYIGLSPSTPKGLYHYTRAVGYRFVATSDNVYPRAEDLETYRAVLGWRASTQTYPQHILAMYEWIEAVEWFVSPNDIKSALHWRERIAWQCKAKLSGAHLLKPKREKTLEELCIIGAHSLGVDLKEPTYAKRLERELEIINSKDFADYFYIIADLVTWSRDRMVVGPARGSSCGSLVCYLLGITTIDPIPYGLLFERFIDLNRNDLPDIDIDLSDKHRDEVLVYLEETYGRERVARLGTVGVLKPRSALNAFGMALRIPKWRVEKFADTIEGRSAGDERALNAIEDALVETQLGQELVRDYPNIVLAGQVEGHPANASQHAAGMVITSEPLANFVALNTRTRSIMCDMRDAERFGLLKIDALGLIQLSIFERAIELIDPKLPRGMYNHYLANIPLYDPTAFDVLNANRFSGVFQFTGRALQGVTRQVKVLGLRDMITLTAIARPGPMDSGGTEAWIARKNGAVVTSVHPRFTELTQETLGVLVFQEQLMQILRQIGGMDWPTVSEVRKAVGKSKGREFIERYRVAFVSGAAAQGVPKGTADAIWDQIITFGRYGFNKSHAVAYAIVSYWCCWFKAHYPLEFAAATLDSKTDAYSQAELLRELDREGVRYRPVDISKSGHNWSIVNEGGQKTLVGPLTVIKGIGPAAVMEIMRMREKGEALRSSVSKKLDGPTTIDSIYPIRDAVEVAFPGGLIEAGILDPGTRIYDCDEVQCGVNGEVVVIAVANRIATKDENNDAAVERRGYKFNRDAVSLNLFVADDSGELLAKIGRFNYSRLAPPILELSSNPNWKPKRSVFIIKGTVPKGFRMIDVTRIKYLCELSEEFATKG